VRDWLEQRGIEAVIPQRSDQIKQDGRLRLDRRAYRRRAKVENSVAWLKENRGVGTRYDKLAFSFLAFVNLTVMGCQLRLLALDDPSVRIYSVAHGATCSQVLRNRNCLSSLSSLCSIARSIWESLSSAWSSLSAT